MRYLGGKHVAGKYIVPHLLRAAGPDTRIWDACCGGLHIAARLAKAGRAVYCTDVHPSLIALYRAVAAGWDPPEHVSRETHKAARALPDSDPMKAFCGFGCSFGGGWFCGYARAAGRDFPSEARRSLLRDVPLIVRNGGSFERVDFLRESPCDLGDAILYLDPPYRGTTSYKGAPPFDHDLFDARVQEWARFCPVFISEYSLPYGELIWEREQKSTVSRDKSVKMRVERLYRV